MSNPHVLERSPLESDLFSSLENHSTTHRSYSKFDFREVSLHLVRDRHVRILAIYARITEAGGHNLATQSLRCRTDAWVVQNIETQELRIASLKCNQRWCPMCSKTKRWIITNSVAEWIGTAHHPKFLTFTLKSSSESVEFQVSRLYEAFVAIRKKAWWKRKVSGGVWFFQMTINKSTGLWHPHIHVLTDGDYIPHKFLSREWLKCTHDSKIVDIRKVTGREEAAAYVAQYATVPGDLLKCTIDQGMELVIGLKGRRMCGSFGTAKGIALRPKKMDGDNPWRKVMSYQMMTIGATFDPYIELIQKAYRDGKPFDADIYGLFDTPSMDPAVLEYKPESIYQLAFEFDDCWYITGRAP